MGFTLDGLDTLSLCTILQCSVDLPDTIGNPNLQTWRFLFPVHGHGASHQNNDVTLALRVLCSGLGCDLADVSILAEVTFDYLALQGFSCLDYNRDFWQTAVIGSEFT